MTDTDVRNDEAQQRYEAVVDGALAGFAKYQLTEDLIVFTHTEIDRAYEGQGVGSALVRAALEDVRRSGDRRVLPICPFVKGWILKHPEYADLLYGARPSTVSD